MISYLSKLNEPADRKELVMISYLSKLNEPADRKELPSYAAGDLPLGRPEVFFNSFRA